MIIVGLSPTVHESAVGLLVDGKVVAAASEERFTRVKNQGGFPHQALEFCLRQAGIEPADVDRVAYAALPFGQERRRDLSCYAHNLAYVARSHDDARRKAVHLANYSRGLVLHREWGSWGGTERAIRREIARRGWANKFEFVDHHRAHCAAAYLTSGLDRALVVSLDGYGSGNAGAVYLGEAGRLQRLLTIPYPHSLGTFYRRVTSALGFEPNRHEGKVVGLAAFGDPEPLHDVVMARFDLSHDDYFRCRSGQDPYFEQRLADAHASEDVAAACQRVLEEVVTLYVQRWMRVTATDQIACAGGVFANVKLNQRIAQIQGVRAVSIFPAMGDSGVGLGAALSLQGEAMGGVSEPLDTLYLGPSFDAPRVEDAVLASGLPFSKPPRIEDSVVERLIQGKVVARFDGAMEFGPRALGNRSILCSATDPGVNDELNARLRRSEFMPFAPISLDDQATDLYANIEPVRRTAQFMTVSTACLDAMRRSSPAAVHVDGTARPQLLTERANPALHTILRRYFERTGVPSLINTSFNIHEEPIVCSPEDAIRAFEAASLDVLAIGHILIDRSPRAS